MKLFIGNLGTEITSHDLLLLFSDYGNVAAANVCQDDEGKPLGYGYVWMYRATDAHKAIRTLDRKKFKEQFLVVNEANSNAHYSPVLSVSG